MVPSVLNTETIAPYDYINGKNQGQKLPNYSKKTSVEYLKTGKMLSELVPAGAFSVYNDTHSNQYDNYNTYYNKDSTGNLGKRKTPS